MISDKDRAQDILVLSRFLLWQEPGALVGGYRAEDAFVSMCNLLNLDQALICAVIRPDIEQDTLEYADIWPTEPRVFNIEKS
jgi:hypothetical protein